MAPQARGCVETFSTWLAGQPEEEETISLKVIIPDPGQPVENVETLSLASLATSCQVSIVQHWHRHKHQLVPLVTDLGVKTQIFFLNVKTRNKLAFSLSLLPSLPSPSS